MQLIVEGLGNRDKAKDETLRGAAVADHEGRRGRKGKKVLGFRKVLRVRG